MNDARRLIAGGLKRLFKLSWQKGAGQFWQKAEPKPAGSQGGQARYKAKPIATKAQTWKVCQLLSGSWVRTEKIKNRDMKRLREPKGHPFGGYPKQLTV